MISDFIGATILLTPIIVLLLAVTPLLDRVYSADGRYALWIFVMIGLWLPLMGFLPRAVDLQIPSFSQPVAAPAVAPMSPMPFPSLPATEISPTDTAADGADVFLTKSFPSHMFTGLTPISVLGFLWVFGVIISVAFHVYGYVVFLRFIRHWGTPKISPHVRAIFERERIALGITREIRLLRVKGIKTPMLFGFLRPTVLLPYSEAIQLEDLPLVLRHELTHFMRHDLFYKLALVATTCLYWFNPAVHLMARQANKDVETICDSLTAGGLSTNERKIYSEIILSMAAGGRRERTALTTHFMGGKNMLKLRFSNILSKAKKRGTAVFVAIGIGIVFVGGFVGFDFAPAYAHGQIFEVIYMDADNLPPFSQMTNVELASWTLQRNHGHCDAEFAELRSRFYVIPGAERSIDRLAPMGLARRLLELKNIQLLHNRTLADSVLIHNAVHDIRIKNELQTRLHEDFHDFDTQNLDIRELAFRLRDWENFTALFSITPGMRDILLLRLQLHYPDISELHLLSNFELAHRLSRREAWRGWR
ncbi:MAG: M56 family metallopeptidase [Defluviitaleaceae bacterium]|nr:M56 family metallopeptidase [Defluviitaleaceae bacterium]